MCILWINSLARIKFFVHFFFHLVLFSCKPIANSSFWYGNITVTTITQNVPHAHEQYETTARNKTAILLYEIFFLNPLRFMS